MQTQWQKQSSLSTAAILGFVAMIWTGVAQATITTEPFQVTRIVDGDTVHGIGADGKTTKVRMQGMDTPELHLITAEGTFAQLPWAASSTRSLEKLVRIGEKVQIRIFGKDKYGRTLGQIVARKVNINLELVRLGAAISYAICTAGDCTEASVREQQVEEFAKACHEAEEQGLGVFDPRQPLDEMPFEFRLRHQHRKADKFVGNLKTGEYVSPENYSDIPVCDRIFFLTEEDAARLGYKFKK